MAKESNIRNRVEMGMEGEEGRCQDGEEDKGLEGNGQEGDASNNQKGKEDNGLAGENHQDDDGYGQEPEYSNGQEGEDVDGEEDRTGNGQGGKEKAAAALAAKSSGKMDKDGRPMVAGDTVMCYATKQKDKYDKRRAKVERLNTTQAVIAMLEGLA